MKKIYIVMGSTGEYSDHREWVVKAFVSEEKAKRLVENASIIARDVFASLGSKYNSNAGGRNPFDPNMDIDYTGTNYSYFETELDDGVYD